jgi:hypothetical protein
MDTRTGIVHELAAGENLGSLARRVGGLESDFVPVAGKPGPCRKCGGTGSRRRGLLSRRFKPCECIALKSE